MAAIAFIIFLTLSTTIHARESQFFAKVSNNNPTQTQPTNTNQQNPDFVPKSQNDGVYGHESGQLPPSATTTTTTATNNNNNINNNNDEYLPANLPENYNPVAYTTPIHSSNQDIPEEFRYEPEAYRYNGESEMYNSQNQGEFTGTNGENMYNSEKQGMSDTRFLENGRYYYAGDNGYNSQKQGFNDARFMETEDSSNMYNSQKKGLNGRYNQGEQMYNSQGMGETRYSTTNNENMYNTGKQGMSDTRFLENGKYFYDLNMENANANTNMNSRGFNSRNEYNTQGYYGNNENSYDRYNTNGGYQNQEEFEQDQFNP